MKALTLKQKVNLKTSHFVLLSFISLGTFSLMWLYKNQAIMMDELEQQFIDKRCILVAAVLFGLSSFFLIQPFMSAFFSFPLNVFYIFWSFRARKAIQKMMLDEYQITYKMNLFYTFFFTFYYINYCINDLEAEVEKVNNLEKLPA